MNYMMHNDRTELRPLEEKKERTVRSHSPLVWAALGCSAVALVLSLGALKMAWPEPVEGQAPESASIQGQEQAAFSGPGQYITFRDHQVPIEEELAVNAWEPAGFTQRENGWLGYESGGVTALAGIDVSAHQGEIDWNRVADSGIKFAMIRAGYRGYGEEGKLVLDERFHENVTGALSAGLDVGVYFFSQAKNVWEAEEEAQLLLEELEGYEVAYPVVFDWESIHHSPARTDDVVGKSVTLMAETFCGLVEQAGYTPGVYFNQSLAYLDLDLTRLQHCVFWLAEYDERPDFYYHADLWQYSSTGKVPGIDTPVDLNLAFRDFDDGEQSTAP